MRIQQWENRGGPAGFRVAAPANCRWRRRQGWGPPRGPWRPRHTFVAGQPLGWDGPFPAVDGIFLEAVEAGMKADRAGSLGPVLQLASTCSCQPGAVARHAEP